MASLLLASCEPVHICRGLASYLRFGCGSRCCRKLYVFVGPKAFCRWLDLKQWYKVTKCENQYNAMTATMIRKKASSSPKLRGKAGEVRSLVPWLRDVTQRFFAHVPLGSLQKGCPPSWISAISSFLLVLSMVIS